MYENVFIRLMELRDIPQVMIIERNSLLSAWSADGYRSELKRDDSFAAVAFSESEIYGFIIARLITTAEEAEILNIAVRADFQKQKIGTHLLQELKEKLMLENMKDIWLEVRKSNLKAQKFYEKNGFKYSGSRKNFYADPQEDALLMKLQLVFNA